MTDTKMLPPQANEWAQFISERKGTNFPKWPNEAMVKLIFGSYLRKKIDRPKPDWKVLDVGCGFGNNLVPFIDLGCECHGVEIHPDMVADTQAVLDKRKMYASIKLGSNRELPYEGNYFDAVLSVNAIHYEGSESNVLKTLNEFRRVLKPGGVLYISTVGPGHDISRRAEPLGNHRYRVRDWDFRDGQEFYFFEDNKHIETVCKGIFTEVETGLVTEKLMTVELEFLIAVCSK